MGEILPSWLFDDRVRDLKLKDCITDDNVIRLDLYGRPCLVETDAISGELTLGKCLTCAVFESDDGLGEHLDRIMVTVEAHDWESDRFLGIFNWVVKIGKSCGSANRSQNTKAKCDGV